VGAGARRLRCRAVGGRFEVDEGTAAVLELVWDRAQLYQRAPEREGDALALSVAVDKATCSSCATGNWIVGAGN
jgi:hypothetical protein